MAWARLALLQAQGDQLAKLADCFGFEALLSSEVEKPAETASFSDSSQAVTSQAEPQAESLPALFIRLNYQHPLKPDQEPAPDELDVPCLPVSTGNYSFPAPPNLLPIARLLPLLFNGLAQTKTSQSLNPHYLVKRMAQGRPLTRLVKQQQQRWPQRLHIYVDTDQQVYWQDFLNIVQQLQSLLGKDAVSAYRFDQETFATRDCYCLAWPTQDNDHWQLWQAPPSDTAILILGDLGANDPRTALAWQRHCTRLFPRQGAVLTLSPARNAPDNAWLVKNLRPQPLNDVYPLPRHPKASGFNLSKPDNLDSCFIGLSVLPLIDPGLLRQLRRQFKWGDSALEAEIWQHPQLLDAGIGKYLAKELSEAYQQRFQQHYTDSAEAFWQTVKQHHSNSYQGLKQLVNFKQDYYSQQLSQETERYFKQLCATSKQSADDLAKQADLQRQCRTVLALLPDALWLSQNQALKKLAYQLYAIGFEPAIKAQHWPEQLPVGFDPNKLPKHKSTQSEVSDSQSWHIVQTGDQGQIRCQPANTDYATAILTVDVNTERPATLTVADTSYPLTKALNLSLPEHAKAVFSSASLKAELQAIRRPSWASSLKQDAQGLIATIPWLDQSLEVVWQPASIEGKGHWLWPKPFGEDDYGLYVDVTVKNVSQRFRWLEPGSFWMGSPEHEPEREWSGEGTETLHPVTLSLGFWLADTTVTQAFWWAVMGNNPSYFTDDLNNPVEQVSWHDAQAFIDKLNQLLPGLSLQLPSEAQWEYTCRAGTNTPFSFGDNINTEQVNFDGNYPYAGAAKGLYREKTLPVKSLPANPWGLYQMHGNVWEWCADIWQ